MIWGRIRLFGRENVSLSLLFKIPFFINSVLDGFPSPFPIINNIVGQGSITYDKLHIDFIPTSCLSPTDMHLLHNHYFICINFWLSKLISLKRRMLSVLTFYIHTTVRFQVCYDAFCVFHLRNYLNLNRTVCWTFEWMHFYIMFTFYIMFSWTFFHNCAVSGML